MTSRKNHNSIVFLTTLSVYLGLVLVGAAPQILAQTILDKKIEVDYSDSERILTDYALALQDLFVISKDLSAQFSENLKDGRYELDCFFNINPNSSETLGCSGSGTGITSGKFFPSLSKLNKIFPHTIEKDKPQVNFNLILSDKDFSLKLVLNQDFNEQAEQFFNSYGDGLSRIKIQQISKPQVIYQNTEISKNNSQVFIVTRLPRGSLDALLIDSAN